MADKQLREVTCTCCPTGCTLVVELSSSGEAVYVSGAGCACGKSYGPAELTHPERSDHHGVRAGRGRAVVRAHERSRPQRAHCLRRRGGQGGGEGCSAPIVLGDVIVANVCDTGVDVIATRAVG